MSVLLYLTGVHRLTEEDAKALVHNIQQGDLSL